MSDAITIPGGDPKDKETFSFSKDIDGVKKTVRGEEVENGWIITIEKEWQEKLVGGGKDYKFNSWKYISKDNPMDKLNKESDGTEAEDNDINNMLEEVAGASGMLLVD